MRNYNIAVKCELTTQCTAEASRSQSKVIGVTGLKVKRKYYSHFTLNYAAFGPDYWGVHYKSPLAKVLGEDSTPSGPMKSAPIYISTKFDDLSISRSSSRDDYSLG